MEQIAEEIGRSCHFVRDRLLANGVSPEPRGHTNKVLDHQEYERTVFLYCEVGMTIRQVAQTLGVSKSAIQNRLARAGVPRRSKGTHSKWEGSQ